MANSPPPDVIFREFAPKLGRDETKWPAVRFFECYIPYRNAFIAALFDSDVDNGTAVFVSEKHYSGRPDRWLQLPRLSDDSARLRDAIATHLLEGQSPTR